MRSLRLCSRAPLMSIDSVDNARLVVGSYASVMRIEFEHLFAACGWWHDLQKFVRSNLFANTRNDPRCDGWQTMSMRRSLLAGWLLLTVAYAVSASWDQSSQTADSLATAFPAWHVVERGDLDLSRTISQGPWVYEAEVGGLYSNRAPGLIAVTAGVYALVSPFVSDFVVWPATLLAVIASSTAVLFLAVSVSKIDSRLAMPTFVLVGLGTSVWSIAADEIWPHGRPCRDRSSVVPNIGCGGRASPSGLGY